MKKIIPLLILFIFLISSASAATLTVGSTAKYKTIQSAVNAAANGDTIYVNAGTYNELVNVNTKMLTFQGQKIGTVYKYPKVNGFSFGVGSKPGEAGAGNINGFNVTKYGIDYQLIGGNTVRNNYIYTKGVYCRGATCSNNTIINNKFYNCGISLYESSLNSITGNTISKASVGLGMYEGSSCTTITGNTFSCCSVGVACWDIPSILVGNVYKGNTVNIKTGVY